MIYAIYYGNPSPQNIYPQLNEISPEIDSESNSMTNLGYLKKLYGEYKSCFVLESHNFDLMIHYVCLNSDILKEL